MREKRSLDEIFNDFGNSEEKSTLDGAVTICLPKRYKDKYIKKQKETRRQISKNLRALIMAALDRLDDEVEQTETQAS